MAKAADAFRNIGEVSDELGVRKHVLRFWEARFPQLKPMKRGGGRRYYRPADVQLLRGIQHLLQSDGYSIKGVQKILREGGLDEVKRLGKLEAERAPRGGRQPGAPGQGRSSGTPRPLTEAQIGVLRSVAAELAAVQAMLRDAEKAEPAAPRLKRAAAGG